MFKSLCSCISNMDSSRDDNLKPETVKDKCDGLNDLLQRNLHTVRGRRNLIRSIPSSILPTKFDDDDEVGSEDEDGEDALACRNGLYLGQDYEKIKEKCQASGKLFVDPEFPPSLSSLVTNPAQAGQEAQGIEWKRPSELCDEPHFFVDGATRFDVKQGELGDCWLLAAIANLTLHKSLFQRVVPHDQSFHDSYAGIFHYRFWQYGEWVDVVIDDLLPTRDNRLIYMRSTTREEFWSALFEKAYAKLHGSYGALRGGTTCEAMVDFSGGCGEQFDLNQPPQDIFAVMQKAYKHSSMQACSLEPDSHVLEAKTKSGLVRGHAYSLTKVLKAEVDTGRKKGQFPLIRIRNPWGNDTEWKGAWSDGAPEWKYIPDDAKDQYGLTFDEDGEFYMSQKDFLKHYDTLEVCNLTPDTLGEDELTDGKMKWFADEHNGSWIDGKTAGGCRNYINTFASNPQYRVELNDSDDDEDDLCTCIVSLMQKGSRRKKAMNQGDGCLTIGFSLYKVDDPDSTPLPLETDFFRYNMSAARSKSFVNLREVTARFKLPTGIYVIMPTTFEPGQEGDFLLRIFAETDPKMKCVNPA